LDIPSYVVGKGGFLEGGRTNGFGFVRRIKHTAAPLERSLV